MCDRQMTYHIRMHDLVDWRFRPPTAVIEHSHPNKLLEQDPRESLCRSSKGCCCEDVVWRLLSSSATEGTTTPTKTRECSKKTKERILSSAWNPWQLDRSKSSHLGRSRHASKNNSPDLSSAPAWKIRTSYTTLKCQSTHRRAFIQVTRCA